MIKSLSHKDSDFFRDKPVKRSLGRCACTKDQVSTWSATRIRPSLMGDCNHVGRHIIYGKDKGMQDKFMRTQLLLGTEGMDILKNSRVLVFGVGGVGGYVVEALARSGVGAIDIVDNDTVSITNINRQIIATTKSIGKSKVDVMTERIKDINPDCRVKAYKTFFLPENSHNFEFQEYDYIVDAIDTVTAKIELIICCQKAGTPIISSMGTGNKLDPTKLQVTDIYKTSGDPLARVMRHELKKRNVKHLKVVYSTELPVKHKDNIDCESADIDKNSTEAAEFKSYAQVRKAVPGSVAFVPPVAGMILAGEVIKDLIKKHGLL